MADNELDVRQLRKPDKHPTIFAANTALPVGVSFILVNNHDPEHLRAEFDTDHPGSYDWEYLWLPRRSRRQFTAGPDGLRYLTVHQRRQALVLEPFKRPKTPVRQAI
jgi:hypothetical protein